MKDTICKVGFKKPFNAKESKHSKPICGRRHTKKFPATVSEHLDDVTCIGCLIHNPSDAAHNHPLLKHLKD